MMMPSTMILLICILMVLKRNHGLSSDIGSRYETAERTSISANADKPHDAASRKIDHTGPKNLFLCPDGRVATGEGRLAK